MKRHQIIKVFTLGFCYKLARVVLGNLCKRGEKDGKKPVPNAGTESGWRRECSQMLGTLLFPDFYGKNPADLYCFSQSRNVMGLVPKKGCDGP